MSYNDTFKTFPRSRFTWNEYDRIGSGSNGTVTKAVDLESGRVIALKFQRRDRRPGAPVLRQQRNEHIIHATLSDHPHIVTLIDTFVNDSHVITAMSICKGGDLFAAVFKDHFRLRVDELRDGFLQLVSALEFMHDNGMYHRDLKLENVLLCEDMETWKIADFGWATTNEMTEEPGLGSTFYRSPEILRGHYYNRDADIYALGMIFFVAVAQCKPWSQPSRRDVDFRLYLSQGPAFLQSVACVSDVFCEFISHFLTADPLDRITLIEAERELESINPIHLRCMPAGFLETPRAPPRPPRSSARKGGQPSSLPMPSLVRTTSVDTWSASSSFEQPSTPPATPPSTSPAAGVDLRRTPAIRRAPAILPEDYMATGYMATPSKVIVHEERVQQKLGLRSRVGATLRRAIRSLQGRRATFSSFSLRGSESGVAC